MLRSSLSYALAIAIGLAVALPQATALATQSSAQADLPAQIDTYVHSRMPSVRTPGVALVVVDGDQVILSQGYGFANREAGTPMTADTPVAAGSTTKPMTALAIMQLVDRGLVDLDTPVTTYLPDFRMADDRAAEITLRHVLSHTAGIPQGAIFDGAQDVEALERHVAGLSAVPLNRAPGIGYEYANDGYSVAGLVIQRLSGMSYEEYMTQFVLAPLGMHRTLFDPSDAVAAGWAQGYAKRRGVVVAAPVVLSRGIGPASTMVTTSNDVGQYFLALLNGGSANGESIISQDALDQMWTPLVRTGDGPGHYGLGWSITEVHGQRVLAHSGSIETSGSYFLVAPDRQIAVGVLTNMTGVDKAELATEVLTLALGERPVSPAPAADWRLAASQFAPSPTAWSGFLGVYRSAQGPLRIYLGQDQLHIAAGEAVFDLVPLSDATFILLGDETEFDEVPVEFRRDADGSVRLYVAGSPFAAKA